jgi:hypothetical protein
MRKAGKNSKKTGFFWKDLDGGGEKLKKRVSKETL